MSNSPRAKVRRTKRKQASKQKRNLMSSQHFGDKYSHAITEAKQRKEPTLEQLQQEFLGSEVSLPATGGK
jgi:hypothetical protein